MGQRRGELKKDSQGQFYRQLGWKPGIKGQPKFRLGKDRGLAQTAYGRLGSLWDLVVGEHEARHASPAPAGAYWPPEELASYETPRPEWSEESLTIANAIRKHQHVIRVGLPEGLEGAVTYATYLDGLRQRYGKVIEVLPADEVLIDEGKQHFAHLAEHRARKARHSARVAAVPVPVGLIGKTLYEAIDAYASRSETHNKRESGRVEAGNARRLKDSSPNVDLSELGTSALERIRDYWAGRPVSKASGGKQAKGKAISLTTVDNHLATARRFAKWLDRTDEFDWELPRHGLDSLKANLKRLRTGPEIAQRRHGVKVFTVEQLTLIYRHATDRDRMLLLLGLNAGMTQAEVSSLRRDEIELDSPTPTIKRIRGKSVVYGEFLLWEATIQALRYWWDSQHPPSELALLNAKGKPLSRQPISNAWAVLRRRIERDTGERLDWWLSFKHLRKTGGQFVRDASDGEIAGVFLSHGNPVVTDPLADVYSNRPFHRVADALRDVEERLAPVWASEPAPRRRHVPRK